MVAALWGINIGGAYPVLAIITSGESVQKWLREDGEQSKKKIEALTVSIREHEADLEKLTTELKEAPARHLKRQHGYPFLRPLTVAARNSLPAARTVRRAARVSKRFRC